MPMPVSCKKCHFVERFVHDDARDISLRRYRELSWWLFPSG